MKSEQELSSEIMKRIYRMHFLRQITSPVARIAVLAVLALALKQLVSVTSVLQNMSHTSGISGFVNYAVTAFTGTHFLVQLTLIAAAFVAALFVRDLVVSLRAPNPAAV